MSTGDMEELGQNNHDRRPVPDPTELTIALVDKAIMGLQKLIEARLDGIGLATKLLGDATDKFPAFVDMKTEHLRNLHDEKFTSVEDLMKVQFAALSKLSDKQEANTTKEIDGLKILIQSEKKSTDEKISAAEVRVTRIESIGVGRVTAEKDTQTDKSSVVSMVAVVVSVLALLASVIISIMAK